ncbi:hypothetical protein G6F57_016799 [Rhizopus arrhizus]|nr:hypothetical protein G6F57_016799 [Rhizopus arrhizus]
MLRSTCWATWKIRWRRRSFPAPSSTVTPSKSATTAATWCSPRRDSIGALPERSAPFPVGNAGPGPLLEAVRVAAHQAELVRLLHDRAVGGVAEQARAFGRDVPVAITAHAMAPLQAEAGAHQAGLRLVLGKAGTRGLLRADAVPGLHVAAIAILGGDAAADHATGQVEQRQVQAKVHLLGGQAVVAAVFVLARELPGAAQHGLSQRITSRKADQGTATDITHAAQEVGTAEGGVLAAAAAAGADVGAHGGMLAARRAPADAAGAE